MVEDWPLAFEILFFGTFALVILRFYTNGFIINKRDGTHYVYPFINLFSAGAWIFYMEALFRPWWSIEDEFQDSKRFANLLGVAILLMIALSITLGTTIQIDQ